MIFSSSDWNSYFKDFLERHPKIKAQFCSRLILKRLTERELGIMKVANEKRQEFIKKQENNRFFLIYFPKMSSYEVEDFIQILIPTESDRQSLYCSINDIDFHPIKEDWCLVSLKKCINKSLSFSLMHTNLYHELAIPIPLEGLSEEKGLLSKVDCKAPTLSQLSNFALCSFKKIQKLPYSSKDLTYACCLRNGLSSRRINIVNLSIIFSSSGNFNIKIKLINSASSPRFYFGAAHASTKVGMGSVIGVQNIKNFQIQQVEDL